MRRKLFKVRNLFKLLLVFCLCFLFSQLLDSSPTSLVDIQKCLESRLAKVPVLKFSPKCDNRDVAIQVGKVIQHLPNSDAFIANTRTKKLHAHFINLHRFDRGFNYVVIGVVKNDPFLDLLTERFGPRLHVVIVDSADHPQENLQQTSVTWDVVDAKLTASEKKKYIKESVIDEETGDIIKSKWPAITFAKLAAKFFEKEKLIHMVSVHERMIEDEKAFESIVQFDKPICQVYLRTHCSKDGKSVLPKSWEYAMASGFYPAHIDASRQFLHILFINIRSVACWQYFELEDHLTC